MFNEITKIVRSRKIARAKIKGGFAYSGGDWKDIIDTSKDNKGNELYHVLVGIECGHKIIRCHLEEELIIKIFDLEDERREQEAEQWREMESLRRRQAKINHINNIRTQISKLEFEGRRFAAAQLEYDLNHGLI